MQFAKNCKTSAIILCMYMIPIFIFGTYYRDDNGRVVSQYFGWDEDGRPLTNIIIKFLNFGGRLTDLAPMSQILSIVISAITCGIICSFVIKNNRLSVVISTTFLFLSPFYLQNIIYRFDVVTMAISILFAAIPFLFIKIQNIYAHMLISFISVICLLSTYQASLPVFYSLLLLSFVFNGDVKINICRALSGAASLFVYYFIISPMYVGGEYAKYRAESIDTKSESVINSVILNFSNLFDNLHVIINYKFFVIFSMVLAALLIKSTYYLINNKNNLKGFILFSFFLLAFMFSFGIFFLLKKPVYEPRVMIGINAIIMMISIAAVSGWDRRLCNVYSIISIIPPLLFFFSMATNYINASNAYVKYEEDTIRSMYYDYKRLDMSGVAYIDGYLLPPYITEQILNEKPFLRNIVGSRIGGLTSYLSKSDFPLFNFSASDKSIDSIVSCGEILSPYNGVYTTIRIDDKNYFSLKEVNCK